MFTTSKLETGLNESLIQGELSELSDKKLRKTIISAFNACNNSRLYKFIQRADTLTYRNMKIFVYAIKEWVEREKPSKEDDWITSKVPSLLSIHTDRSLMTLYHINMALKNPFIWALGVPIKRVIKNSEIRENLSTVEMMDELEATKKKLKKARRKES